MQSVFLARHTEASQLTKLKQTKFTAVRCLGKAVGLTLSLAGCAVAPEPRVARLPSVVALAKVRLDPVAATAKLNAYRAEKGLNSLRLDPALTAMAERQAQAMAASGTMSHEVAGAFSSRLAASGIKSTAGENLGEGYMSFDEAFSDWRSSAGHDANLLMPDATRFGIALAKNSSAGYGAYWAMVVAAEQRTMPGAWFAPFPMPIESH